MSCMYLNADKKMSLPSFKLERVFRADFVFDKAYPKKTFETSVPEFVYADTVNGASYDYEFDPVMWYCSQMNESFSEIKWWDTPNGSNSNDSIWFPYDGEDDEAEEDEKEIFPYNTPIKCEEQVIGLGKSKKRTFWLKKVVVEQQSDGEIKYTSCMAEGKKKYGVYKINNYTGGKPSGWEFSKKIGKKNKKFRDFILRQGIDMDKNVKNVYREINSVF